MFARLCQKKKKKFVIKEVCKIVPIKINYNILCKTCDRNDDSLN